MKVNIVMNQHGLILVVNRSLIDYSVCRYSLLINTDIYLNFFMDIMLTRNS